MTTIENMKGETVSKAIQGMVEYGSMLRSNAHKTLANLEGFKSYLPYSNIFKLEKGKNQKV